MKNLRCICTLLAFNLCAQIHAQEVVKVDTLSGTELTISMDSRVENALSDMEESCLRTSASAKTSGSTRGNTAGNSGTSTTVPKKVMVANRPLTQAEICRKNPRILGVKIQLAVVKSNEEANEVKAYFRRRFPQLKVETDASLRPNYKILAGSYISKQSAASDLSKIRQYFKSAIPISYRVFCVEAK